jgi:hypothetical protein
MDPAGTTVFIWQCKLMLVLSCLVLLWSGGDPNIASRIGEVKE